MKRIKWDDLSDDASQSDYVDMFVGLNIFNYPKLVIQPPSRDHHLHHQFHSIPEELLAMEIFPRLPDYKTLLRCSVLNKYWNSLLTAPEFLTNSLSRRRKTSYGMFVGFTFRGCKTTRQMCPRTLTVAADGSRVTSSTASYYDFTLPFAIDSACEDFLLLSANWNQIRHLYIQNAVTRQWLQLPDPPMREQSGFSAMVSHRDSARSRYSFRVVYLTCAGVETLENFFVTVFSPETGQWSYPSLAVKPPEKFDAVAVNGLLYWADVEDYRRLVIFDAFAMSLRLILFPVDLAIPSRSLLLHPPPQLHGIKVGPVRPLVGMVQGRLQLAQLISTCVATDFVMKLSQLSSNGTAWDPMSEFIIKKPPSEATAWLYLLSFHPEDGDMVFLCCNSDVYTYRLSVGEYTRVCTLSRTDSDEDPRVARWLPRFAHVHTVKLPPWPTPMPSLPWSGA